MTLTWLGIREWGAVLLILLLILGGCYWLIAYTAWSLAGWLIAVLAAAAAAAMLFFFRNPRRQIPANPLLLVSPADGVVKAVEAVEDFTQSPFSGKAVRITIRVPFLSVRLNRAPAGLRVKELRIRSGYQEGDARGEVREESSITVSGLAGEGENPYPLAVRQISDTSVRRIVCRATSGKFIKRGAVYGMVRSGSRIEVYLPPEGVISDVKAGDRLTGGESVIATVTR